MCGIAGIFAYRDDAAPVDEAELLRIREHMARRGPDGAGAWLSADRRIGLAHRRLAIIDLSAAGEQPMLSADGRLTITFNGEIYNYRELRRELEAKGFAFHSQSDTEVLLHLYAERGAQMMHALRGMFAFGIWDARERTLFLARDPFGIKPLYYADDGKTLRFASQVKALLKGGGVNAAPEPAGAAGFLLWGCVPEPYTLHRDVLALPAGATLTVASSGAAAPGAYFSVREVLFGAQSEARTFRVEDRAALAEALRESVQHHLVSDVPVAAFLSSGLDSSLVASLAAEEASATLRTLTLGFREYAGLLDDEVPLAEKVAAALGTRHETHWIVREDFGGELQSILDAMDQPSTDGVNTYLVCRAAARAGIKVALSGLGGDELFGGYPSFRDVPRIARWLRPAALVPHVGRLARALAHPLVSRLTSPKFASLLEYGGSYQGAYLLRRALYLPWELRQALDPVAVHVGLERLQTQPSLAALVDGIRPGRARVAAMELSWYMRNQLLRDADWAGMAHSVEIRVPLIDASLFKRLAPWIVGSAPPGKVDAAISVATPHREELLRRPKTGFSVPVREWLAGTEPLRRDPGRGLRGWARRILPPQPRQFRALALVSDGFGGHGGIAKFNRDLLATMSAMADCAQVVVVPRNAPARTDNVPPRIRIRTDAAQGKRRFLRAAASEMLAGPFDLVIAGHINFASVANLIAAFARARSIVVIHGIDAWTRHHSPLVRLSVPFSDFVVGVSRTTLERFAHWSGYPAARCRLLPNCVDFHRFAPGPRPAELAARLGIAGRTVIMTLGRLASEERYKGFDEVLEVLADVAREVPDIAYLVCGDGPDRERLTAKAAALGVGERVVFAGFVPEESKAEYYRLADAYVMPSRGEGFGIVLLEAMASGLPVVGSSTDGTREALLGGALGEVVDPSQPEEVRRGILRALARDKQVPEGARQFSVSAFHDRTRSILREVISAQ